MTQAHTSLPTIARIAALLCLSVVPSAALGASGTAHAPGAEIAYEILEGPPAATPLIVVNGGPGLTHAYMVQNDVWARLARGRRIVFYDQRGTGASKPTDASASYGLDAQVADLDAVRAAIGAQKIAVLGDSFGGYLAMGYALAHPEHVERLLLSDAAPPSLATLAPQLATFFPDVTEEDAALAKQFGDTPETATRELRNHFRMLFYSGARRDAYLARFTDMGFTPETGNRVFAALAKTDLTPELASIACPTLVMNGRFDVNVTPSVAWSIAKAIPNAKLVFFEESGHLPAYEEPEKYVATVEAFLATR